MKVLLGKDAEKLLKGLPLAKSSMIKHEKELLKIKKYPVVIKIISPQAIHKTEIGGIKIVNDFLEVSRLEQGRLQFDGKPFPLPDLCAEVVADLKGLATNKGLELRFDTPASPLPQALADRDKVKEVLTNFTGNAIHYSHAGSVVISVAVADNQLKVRVKDTGVGIAPHDQQLLFRKFQQAGDVLARDNTQSTGLGLYISKLLIEAMEGTAFLEESTPEKGSTFSFTLPIAS